MPHYLLFNIAVLLHIEKSTQYQGDTQLLLVKMNGRVVLEGRQKPECSCHQIGM